MFCLVLCVKLLADFFVPLDGVESFFLVLRKFCLCCARFLWIFFFSKVLRVSFWWF